MSVKRRKSPKKALPSLVELAAKQSLRVEEFALLNSISRSQSFKEIHAGRLRVLRVGKRFLITPEAVRDWQTASTPAA
jgi:excisionase family DNA binding protein